MNHALAVLLVIEGAPFPAEIPGRKPALDSILRSWVTAEAIRKRASGIAIPQLELKQTEPERECPTMAAKHSSQ